MPLVTCKPRKYSVSPRYVKLAKIYFAAPTDKRLCNLRCVCLNCVSLLIGAWHALMRAIGYAQCVCVLACVVFIRRSITSNCYKLQRKLQNNRFQSLECGASEIS